MAQKSNAERFIIAFSSVERSLNRITRRPRYVPFRLNARISARYNSVVKNHLEELCSCAELRNSIVHWRDGREEIVAEPSDAITEDLERIADLLTQDQQVINFATTPVISCQVDDTMESAIALLDENQIDEMPVYSEGKFMGLLSINQMLHYMLAHEDPKAPVSSILKESTKESVLFMASNTMLQSVVLLYEDFAAIQKRSPIIIITQTGEHDEPPLGIITMFDLARISAYLA